MRVYNCVCVEWYVWMYVYGCMVGSVVVWANVFRIHTKTLTAVPTYMWTHEHTETTWDTERDCETHSHTHTSIRKYILYGEWLQWSRSSMCTLERHIYTHKLKNQNWIGCEPICDAFEYKVTYTRTQNIHMHTTTTLISHWNDIFCRFIRRSREERGKKNEQLFSFFEN